MNSSRQDYWCQRYEWKETLSFPRRVWCSSLLVLLYAGDAGYMHHFLPAAFATATLFFVPENRLLLLIRSALFWGLALALIQRFDLDGNPIFSKDDLVLQPVFFLMGCYIGFQRYKKIGMRSSHMEHV